MSSSRRVKFNNPCSSTLGNGFFRFFFDVHGFGICCCGCCTGRTRMHGFLRHLHNLSAPEKETDPSLAHDPTTPGSPLASFCMPPTSDAPNSKYLGMEIPCRGTSIRNKEKNKVPLSSHRPSFTNIQYPTAITIAYSRSGYSLHPHY